MNDEQLLTCALDVGEEMLCCGAEIHRVEDTVERIGLAYGARRVDAFTITSSIVATLWREGTAVTQTRRIRACTTDLERLRRLNALSRKICAQRPDCAQVHAELSAVLGEPSTSARLQYVAFALIAGAFCVFFGGTVGDALVSAAIGVTLKWLMAFARRLSLNAVLSNGLLALAGGLIALAMLRLGLGDGYDRIVIGDIMLLIPGIALTNAFCDMIGGDLISSVQRFCEALLNSAAIAVGFAYAQRLML